MSYDEHYGGEMIAILGGTQSQKAHVESMISFCLEKLMPRLRYKVDITVRLSRTLCSASGLMGSCMELDGTKAPRSFHIEADSSQRLRTLLTTIAHEMVHVKQYARNEQQFVASEGKYKWQGKKVDIHKTDYWDLPWEIEAHGRETGLFVNWCIANGHQNKSWTFDRNEK